MSENEWNRMIEGKLYNPTDKEIEKRHLRGLMRCDKFNRISLWQKRRKQRALFKLIPSARENGLVVFAPFYCEYGVNIHVGKECFINYNCVFLDISPITLGNGVMIGANVTLATPNHPLVAEERINQDYPDGRHDLEYSKPIIIGNGCWICSGAIICGGVRIGENSVVAAGSVVTKDVPSNSLVAGVPAKVIRTINEDDRLDVLKTYQNNEIPLPSKKKNI